MSIQKKRTSCLVGLTGGIGSGKSMVAGFLRGMGRVVISADSIARTLTENDAETLSGIRGVFGSSIFTPDGSLDRKKLASIVFADQTRLAILNGIVHPRVIKEIERVLLELPVAERAPYVALEAPLVYESGLDVLLEFVVAVHAEEDLRIKRVMQRDGCSPEEVTRRIESQMPTKELLARADFAIENNGTEDELRGRVLLIDQLLSALATGTLSGSR